VVCGGIHEGILMAVTFLAEYESTWNDTTTPKTSSITTAPGDALVALGLSEAGTNTALTTPTGGTGLTWTLRQSDVASFEGAWLWTAIATTAETFTFSLARGVNARQWGFNVLKFGGVSAIGASNKATFNPGTPSVALTTTQANSAIVVGIADTSAKDGASRVWLTSAGAFTEQTYAFSSTIYTAYAGWYSNVGAVGSKTVGLSAPTSQTAGILAVELKAFPDPIGRRVSKRQAMNRSYLR
jgi:hypothetical protein